MWNALKNGLTQSAALAGIHAYSRALAADKPAAAGTISTILAAQGIALTASPYAEDETNFGSPALANVNPIYLNYGAFGTTLGNICLDNTADPLRHGNKAGEFRYVRFSLAQSGTRTVTVTQTSSGASDPDLVLYDRRGRYLQANGNVPRTETISASLPAGDYVLVVTDFNLSTSCFSLTIQ